MRIVLLLSPRVWFDLAVLVSAIHPSAISGFKGQLCSLATLSTHFSEHLSPGLPWLAVTAASRRTVALYHPGRAAPSAALGIIGEALLSEQLLLAGAEGEINPAVRALDAFIHITHGVTFFLEIVG